MTSAYYSQLYSCKLLAVFFLLEGIYICSIGFLIQLLNLHNHPFDFKALENVYCSKQNVTADMKSPEMATLTR